MTDVPASHQDLLGTSTAILTTLGSTGIPHTTAVWFLFDEVDGAVKLWLSDARQKTKNLMKRPACSLFILDLENPARYISLRGHASLAPDTDCVFGDRVGEKYGVDVRRMLNADEIRYVVTIDPIQVQVR